MEIPEQLQCLFSAEIDEREDSYVIEIPRRELQQGTVQSGETYRVGLLASQTDRTERDEPDRTESDTTNSAPVSEGATREVEIEDIGVQGDGVARVERGFVVIVPDTDRGERVTIEITDVRENVAFAEVIERHPRTV